MKTPIFFGGSVKKANDYVLRFQVWRNQCVWMFDSSLLKINSLPCRDGRPLNDDEIAGMLIGLLLAGQHTSSTTSAWMGFFLARDRALQERCHSEQKTVCGEDLPPLQYDQVILLHWFIACNFFLIMYYNKLKVHYETFFVNKNVHLLIWITTVRL